MIVAGQQSKFIVNFEAVASEDYVLILCEQSYPLTINEICDCKTLFEVEIPCEVHGGHFDYEIQDSTLTTGYKGNIYLQ